MDLDVIVTSGKTITEIDDVRFIANESKGTTGALIAEEFLKRGARVNYIHGVDAKIPFKRGEKHDYDKPQEVEEIRIRSEREQYQNYKNKLNLHPVRTFNDYTDTLFNLLKTSKTDVIVLAMAASDWGYNKFEGKIDSSQDELILRFFSNPKLIAEVRKKNPHIFQIGFKLKRNVSILNLIEEGYSSGVTNGNHITYANLAEGIGFKDRKIFLITPEKGITAVPTKESHISLVDMTYKRLSKKHYKTILNVNKNYRSEFELSFQEIKNNVRRLHKLNLFENYFEEDPNKQFGFVALRLPNKQGFLITGRGSNKSQISLDEIVHVSSINFKDREIKVNSTGKKASLNANIAGKIFEERPEINIILHSHIFPGFSNKTKIDYSPGAQEDLEEVMAHLRNKEVSVELINHGIISVGSNVEDIIKTLDIEPVYTNFPELYDAVYHRFQHSTEFIDLISKSIRSNGSILDLAAGTGEVSKKLQEKGYKNISLADQSRGMLEIAKKKLKEEASTYVTSIQKMCIEEKYDSIIVRQAINYLKDNSSLTKGFKKIYEHLNKEGKFIFNAPSFNNLEKFTDRVFEYEYEKYNVKVKEMNVIEDKTIIHTQNCMLIKKDGSEIKKVYDLNKFRIITKGEFESALQEAGFRSIKFLGKNLEDYSSSSKTIYCVAKK